VALIAMLGFAGVMEIELSDFCVEVVWVEDPQPAIDIRAIGAARDNNLARRCSEFMFAFFIK
jgi:hypothetical protein